MKQAPAYFLCSWARRPSCRNSPQATFVSSMHWYVKFRGSQSVFVTQQLNVRQAFSNLDRWTGVVHN
jgi:hypothetical protein